MRVLLLAVLLVAAAVPAFAARTGTIDQIGGGSFRACYLTPENPSVCNYAMLYKGLKVEIIGGSASSRWKIRVNMSDSRAVEADGWRSGAADAKGEGWVSPRFLVVDEATSTDVGSGLSTTGASGSFASGASGDHAGGTSSGNGGVALDRTGDGNQANGLNILGERTGGRDLDPASGEATGTGTADLSGPGVYYLFAGMGEDEEWFFSLVQNRKPAGEPNRVWEKVREDIGATRHSCKGVVAVKILKPEDVLTVLRGGMVPKAGLERVPSGGSSIKIWGIDELVASDSPVLGFMFVSHAGSDGPLVNYHKGGKQLNAAYFVQDRKQPGFFASLFGSSDKKTVADRVVPGARFTLAGCNTGNCQYWDGFTPSFCHLLALIYADKNVAVRGKKTRGNPNATSSAYVTFGRSGQQYVTRTSPGKKEYSLRVQSPQNVYDEYTVPYGSTAERDAILAYYRARDVDTRVQASQNRVWVRSPRFMQGRVLTRSSNKDNLLKGLFTAMAQRREVAVEFVRNNKGQVTPRALGDLTGDETASVAEARSMAPSLEKLLDSDVMQFIINQVKKDNGGVLDLNDFRLWIYTYYGVLETSKTDITGWNVDLRSCTCNDELLQRELCPQSLR